MATAGNKRKSVPNVDQTALFGQSRRRCCVCFGINNDFAEKHGQIAHLDGDPSNSAQDNLAWLCLEHHDRFDSKTSQSKGLTMAEVKMYRSDLYEAIERQRTAALPQISGAGHDIASIWSENAPDLVKETLGNKTADKMIQYRGFGPFIGLCRLRVYKGRGGKPVVIVTQFNDNPGTSIANVAESLATQVYDHELGRPRTGMVWIQHFVAMAGAPDTETYDLVTFSDGPNGFVDPVWRRLTLEQVIELVGHGI
jgi:hypothetical protein